jgi:hypothetical protein
MPSHARQAPSFVFEYDYSATWTENCRRRAYAIQASPSSDDGDPVAKWERQCAAETVKYFETEHDEVVADAERRAAADPRSTRPHGGGEAYDRAMAKEALGLHDLADQQLWGDEAIAAFLPIAKAARGGKDNDPSLDNHIDCLARTFVWRFIKAKKSNTTMEPLDNVVPPPKPPAPTDDWLARYVRNNGPLSIHRWAELFPRRSFRYALYRFERLRNAERLTRAWMPPHVDGVMTEPLHYAPSPLSHGTPP